MEGWRRPIAGWHGAANDARKTVEQQSMLMVHRVREFLIRQRTAAVNALRGICQSLASFGPRELPRLGNCLIWSPLMIESRRLPATRSRASSVKFAIPSKRLLHSMTRFGDGEGEPDLPPPDERSHHRSLRIESLLATVGDPRYFSSGDISRPSLVSCPNNTPPPGRRSSAASANEAIAMSGSCRFTAPEPPFTTFEADGLRELGLQAC